MDLHAVIFDVNLNGRRTPQTVAVEVQCTVQLCEKDEQKQGAK